MKLKIESVTEYIYNDNCIICKVIPKSESDDFGRLITSGSGKIMRKYYNRPDYFKGVARLKDGDIDNPEEGKAIARRKAMRAMYRWYGNLATEALIEQTRLLDEKVDLVASAFAKADEFDREIVKIVAGEGID